MTQNRVIGFDGFECFRSITRGLLCLSISCNQSPLSYNPNSKHSYVVPTVTGGIHISKCCMIEELSPEVGGTTILLIVL
jgi:hypothetical protein